MNDASALTGRAAAAVRMLVDRPDGQGSVGGRQTAQGWYRTSASANRIDVAPFASERQPARWYFVPVFVM
jgi:hypothetical protein